MATKNISLKVTDADPSGYTYVGLYADSSYKQELTTSKSYSFNVNSGSTTDLFIRYKKSPFKLSFKQNSNMAYTISMNYDGTSYSIEVPVGDSVIQKSFELSETSANQLIITSIVSTTAGQEVSNVKLDNVAITLPYTKLVNNWNGETHVVSVENVQTTTTTTSSTTLPSTSLYFKKMPAQDGTSNYMSYNITYSVQGATDITTKVVTVSNADVIIPITYEAGSTLTLTINSIVSSAYYEWHSNKILYRKRGDSSYQNINIPGNSIAINTTTGNEVTPVVYWDGPTTDVIFKASKDVTGTSYIPYTAQYVDSNFETKSVTVSNQDVTVAALTPATSSHLWILNDISTDAEIGYKNYSYSGTTTLSNGTNTITVNTPNDIINNIESGYVQIIPDFTYVDTTTTTTSTAAPAIVNLQSNVASTAYIGVTGQADKTVTLAADTKTGVSIDMN